MGDDDFVPYLTVNGTLVTDFKVQFADEFEEKLKLLLERIIDPKNDFPCAESDKACIFATLSNCALKDEIRFSWQVNANKHKRCITLK